ncbi:hypothetical protein CYV19_18715, partial [Natronobacterium gregoryi SP2]
MIGDELSGRIDTGFEPPELVFAESQSRLSVSTEPTSYKAQAFDPDVCLESTTNSSGRHCLVQHLLGW